MPISVVNAGSVGDSVVQGVRNLIINNAFQIWQRGTSASFTIYTLSPSLFSNCTSTVIVDASILATFRPMMVVSVEAGQV